MKKLYLKPAAGLKVPDPVTGKPLAAEGEEKPDTTYWRRRIKDGDVAIARAPKPAKEGKDK